MVPAWALFKPDGRPHAFPAADGAHDVPLNVSHRVDQRLLDGAQSRPPLKAHHLERRDGVGRDQRGVGGGGKGRETIFDEHRDPPEEDDLDNADAETYRRMRAFRRPAVEEGEERQDAA